MKKDDVNKLIVERLRKCPKLQCNFWSRGNHNYDGDVSDITFEGGDFWRRGGPSLLYLAEKRFDSYDKLSNDVLPTKIYDENDVLVEQALYYCGDRKVEDALPDSKKNSQTSTEDNSVEDLALLRSIRISYEDGFEAEQQQEDGDGIPKLETKICESENEKSFDNSSSTTYTKNCSGNFGEKGCVVENTSHCETEGMDELYERIINTSGLSAYTRNCSGNFEQAGGVVENMDELYERIINTSGLTASTSFNNTTTTTTTTTTNNDVKDVTDSSWMMPHDVFMPLPRASRTHEQSGIEFSDVKTTKFLNLFVDDYPETSFFSLLDSLQSNRAIEKIVVFRNRTTDGKTRTRTMEDMDNLFHVIHNLSKSLVELVLYSFRPEDMSSFCFGMQVDNPSSIRYLQLHMEHGTLNEQSVEMIASMPSLISLELEVQQSFPVWTLLESESLVQLGVVSTSFHFEPSDVLRLAGRIRTNSVLKVLDLEPRIPSWSIGAVMASLRFSHTSQLEIFRFSCSNDSEGQGDACMAEILKTIEYKYETRLRVLWNHSVESFSVSEDVRRDVLAAVGSNPSLKQFHLFSENSQLRVVTEEKRSNEVGITPRKKDLLLGNNRGHE